MKVSFFGLLCCLSLCGAQQCLDEDGKPVDWYVMYKLPRHSAGAKSANPLIDQGLAYLHIDSSNAKSGWILSSKSVGDETSIPGRTLSPLYDRKNDLVKVLYNDENPNGTTSFTDGHTKGVAVFGKESGFWLVHSVPKFPPHIGEGKYGYPHTGQMYGQSFLCISMPTQASADKLGVQMTFNRPYVYDFHLPAWAKKQYLRLAAAIGGEHVKKPPFYGNQVFTSLTTKTAFSSYAKASKFDKDLYADYVAPALRTGLLVETWPNGPGRMTSSCKQKFEVENVQDLSFAHVHPRVNFTTKHDHSKWAISMDAKNPQVCIGDINRMNSQKTRAGGTVCFQNHYVWKTFGSSVADVETCPKVKSKSKVVFLPEKISLAKKKSKFT